MLPNTQIERLCPERPIDAKGSKVNYLQDDVLYEVFLVICLNQYYLLLLIQALVCGIIAAARWHRRRTKQRGALSALRIDTLDNDVEKVEQSIRDLNLLLDQPSTRQARPCPGCSMPCPCSASTTCGCGCAPTCSQAPKSMSSEPERYPIETKIVPLVYEFYTLRVCRPCWSCEGHVDGAGEVIKIPRVWFYSRSLVYPRLITEVLMDLDFKKRLSVPWHICVVNPGDALDTTFSLEPNTKFAAEISLSDLQSDSGIVASELTRETRKRAINHLRSLSNIS